MKKISHLLMALVAGAMLTVAPQAQPVTETLIQPVPPTPVSIPVVNFDFQAPDAGKIADGYDGAIDIPGWRSNPMVDSGVDVDNGPAGAGDYAAFIEVNNEGAGNTGPFWQSLPHTIGAFETITVTYDSAWEGKLTRIQSGDGTVTTTLHAETPPFVDGNGNNFDPVSVSYSTGASGGGIGGQLVIEFENEIFGWPKIDNVEVTVTAAEGITKSVGGSDVSLLASSGGSESVQFDFSTVASVAQIDSISVSGQGADTATINGITLPAALAASSATSFTLDWTPTSTVGVRNMIVTVSGTVDGNAFTTTDTVKGSVLPDVVAFWKFEEGAVGNLPFSDGGASYVIGALDSSGNDNHLVDFGTTSSEQLAFSASVAPTIDGPNSFSVEALDGSPDLRTDNTNNPSTPAIDIEDVVLAEWTIEALFLNPDIAAAGNETIVGRDGANVFGQDDRFAPLYLALENDGSIFGDYRDQAGITHHTESANGFFVNNNWYYVALRCDGTTLSLHVADLTAGETEATELWATGTPGDSADADFGPWPDQDNGNKGWSVQRGYWGHGPTDYHTAGSLADEVKISARAIDVATEGLLAIGVPVELGSFELE